VHDSIRSRAFLARRGARIALWILVVLGTLAAWAPFLANDRPYVLVAADHGALERARSELVPLADSMAAAMRAADAGEGPGRERARSLAESESRALAQRIALLEPATGAAALADLRAALAAGRAAESAGRETREFRAAELAAAARQVRDAHASGRLVARSTRSYPLFASLSAVDVFVALLPLATIGAWFARRRFGFVRAALAGTALSATIAVLVAAFGPERVFAAPGALKTAVARGTIDVEVAHFAPIPFGYAETNLAEAWRPPTWLAASRVDADGRYVSGARASAPTAGRLEARHGEPAIDAPLRHLLGTDALGRDVLARTLWGGRISLGIGLAAALLLSAIGTLLGAAAGYLGGFVDGVVSRTIEIVLCFPAFFLVLCAVAWTDPDVVPVPFAIVLVIAAVGWTSTARLVRAEALRVAASDHVTAARALGLHPARVLVRHVLPNSIGPALIAFGFAAGGAIGVESSLAFLGLGAQIPVPSWGGLVGEARGADQAWAWIAPGALVFLAVLAWVLVAESAREALDPRAVGESSP